MQDGAVGSYGFWVWLPVVDAFRTFTACPTPAIRSVFSQIQQLAGI